MQRYAAEQGIAIVFPDTSPRGEDVPDEAERYDLGQGAGFYVNATQSPWSKHYHMYDYVTQELPALLEQKLPLQPDVKSISGHSMGGHGALNLRIETDAMPINRYRLFRLSVTRWNVAGAKAVLRYLGEDKQTWQAYDATELIKAGANAAHI